MAFNASDVGGVSRDEDRLVRNGREERRDLVETAALAGQKDRLVGDELQVTNGEDDAIAGGLLDLDFGNVPFGDRRPDPLCRGRGGEGASATIPYEEEPTTLLDRSFGIAHLFGDRRAVEERWSAVHGQQQRNFVRPAYDPPIGDRREPFDEGRCQLERLFAGAHRGPNGVAPLNAVDKLTGVRFNPDVAPPRNDGDRPRLVAVVPEDDGTRRLPRRPRRYRLGRKGGKPPDEGCQRTHPAEDDASRRRGHFAHLSRRHTGARRSHVTDRVLARKQFRAIATEEVSDRFFAGQEQPRLAKRMARVSSVDARRHVPATQNLDLLSQVDAERYRLADARVKAGGQEEESPSGRSGGDPTRCAPHGSIVGRARSTVELCERREYDQTMVRSPGTGMPGLDEVFAGLHWGDIVVWRVDATEDYAPVVRALAATARDQRLPVLYIHLPEASDLFADADHPLIARVDLDLAQGFERFVTRAHEAIVRTPPHGVIVCDSLTALSHGILSDRMIGNFFTIVATVLADRHAIGYFAVQRYFHSHHAIEPLRDAATLIVDTYRWGGDHYVRVAEATGRELGRRLVLHRIAAGHAYPIRDSNRIARVIASSPWAGLPSASYRMVGVWDRTFMLSTTVQGADEREALKRRLVDLLIARERRMRDLAYRYLTLDDIGTVWRRTIGTGQIGGKAAGMLLARAVVHSDLPAAEHLLEPHDSFFVASDVYYTYLVINHCWWERRRAQEAPDHPDRAERVQRRIRDGHFPSYIRERLMDMLEYFGTVPIVVRSSSLLEDAFGNAFAGTYESVFCANQGSADQRLEELLEAIRVVYASALAPEALQYRAARGVMDQDEQMGLLIQRVSGVPSGDWFAPQLSGVALSWNPYVWSSDIDPAAGLMRLVVGLGTRAVDRHDDDYTRVVALNAPLRRPDSEPGEVQRFAQRRADVLDLGAGAVVGVDAVDLTGALGRPFEAWVASRPRGAPPSARPLLDFERLLARTPFAQTMRNVLTALRAAYETEVEIEFTATVEEDGTSELNIVQCRPLQIHGARAEVAPLPAIRPERVLLETTSGVIGFSRDLTVGRVVAVLPERFATLSDRERYALAEAIGTICSVPPDDGGIVLIAPGRWGTSTPSLGVPVRFSQIRGAAVLCEVDQIHQGLVADLSLGTHFFHEMVEHRLVYLAVRTTERRGHVDFAALQTRAGSLTERWPDLATWEGTVCVVEEGGLRLHVDTTAQRAVLFKDAPSA